MKGAIFFYPYSHVFEKIYVFGILWALKFRIQVLQFDRGSLTNLSQSSCTPYSKKLSPVKDPLFVCLIVKCQGPVVSGPVIIRLRVNLKQ